MSYSTMLHFDNTSYYKMLIKLLMFLLSVFWVIFYYRKLYGKNIVSMEIYDDEIII